MDYIDWKFINNQLMIILEIQAANLFAQKTYLAGIHRSILHISLSKYHKANSRISIYLTQTLVLSAPLGSIKRRMIVTNNT